jgi:hypothetical protein
MERRTLGFFERGRGDGLLDPLGEANSARGFGRGRHDRELGGAESADRIGHARGAANERAEVLGDTTDALVVRGDGLRRERDTGERMALTQRFGADLARAAHEAARVVDTSHGIEQAVLP